MAQKYKDLKIKPQVEVFDTNMISNVRSSVRTRVLMAYAARVTSRRWRMSRREARTNTRLSHRHGRAARDGEPARCHRRGAHEHRLTARRRRVPATPTAYNLVKAGLLEKPLEFGFVMGAPNAQECTLRQLGHLLSMLEPGDTWTSVGVGKFEMPLAYAAIAHGGHVRVGLEDTNKLPNGEIATNYELVEHVVEMAKAMGGKSRRRRRRGRSCRWTRGTSIGSTRSWIRLSDLSSLVSNMAPYEGLEMTIPGHPDSPLKMSPTRRRRAASSTALVGHGATCRSRSRRRQARERREAMADTRCPQRRARYPQSAVDVRRVEVSGLAGYARERQRRDGLGRFADARAVDLDAVERRANTRPFNCRGVLQDERAPCLGRKQRPGRPPPIIVSSYRYDIIEAQRIVVVVASDVLVDVHAAQRRIPPYRSEQAGAPRLRRRQQLPPPAEQVGVARPCHRFDGVDAAFQCVGVGYRRDPRRRGARVCE